MADPRCAYDRGSLGRDRGSGLIVSVLPLHRLGRPMRVPAVPPAAATGSPATAARAAAAPARPIAATAATRAGRLRIRDLHRDSPAIELAPVELRNRSRSLLCRVHLDEPEPPGLPGESIGDHGCGKNVTALCEELPEPFAGRGVRETAYIEFRCHRNPLGLSSALLHAPRTRKSTLEARSDRTWRIFCSVHACPTRASAGGHRRRVSPPRL